MGKPSSPTTIRVVQIFRPLTKNNIPEDTQTVPACKTVVTGRFLCYHTTKKQLPPNVPVHFGEIPGVCRPSQEIRIGASEQGGLLHGRLHNQQHRSQNDHSWACGTTLHDHKPHLTCATEYRSYRSLQRSHHSIANR